MLFSNGRQSAHSAAGDDSDPAAIFIAYLKTALFERHMGRNQCILDKQLEFVCRFFVKVIFIYKVFDFASYLDRVAGRVITGDTVYPAQPGTDVFPGLGNSGTKRSHQSSPGYYYSAASHCCFLGIESFHEYGQ